MPNIYSISICDMLYVVKNTTIQDKINHLKKLKKRKKNGKTEYNMLAC